MNLGVSRHGVRRPLSILLLLLALALFVRGFGRNRGGLVGRGHGGVDGFAPGEEAGVEFEAEEEEQEVAQFREFLDTISPEDFDT